MADYDDLDDATLQQMLSDASSYEERSALRQVLRKRKKERGEAVSRSKARGNSVYNRFAGSTAPKSGATTNFVPSDKSKQEVTSATPYKKDTPKPQQPTKPASPTIDQSSPSLHAQEPIEESDGTPVTVEPLEDESAEDKPLPEEDTPSQEEEIPQQKKEDDVSEELDLDAAEITPSSDLDVHSAIQANGESQQEFTDNSPVQQVGSGTNLQHYLVAYVNQELVLNPPLPTKGKALFDTCSDPTVLCKLINKSVPGTVDLRALSKISGSAAQQNEAMEDNMTLVIESARAIGCQVSDSMLDKIIQRDPEVINNLLVDLIRARVVHMPGMEDEPSATFTDLDTLFEKLHISLDDKQEREDDGLVSPDSITVEQADSTELTYEERAARRKAEREQRLKREAEEKVEFSYEDRAAQRRADRERRRREREARAK